MDNNIMDQNFVNFEDPNFKPWGMDLKTFCMLMHLAQLASVIIPLGGFVLPIVMWATNKDQSSTIDQHGKNILNWIITSVIVVAICFALTFVFIGPFLLMAFGLASLIFIIMAAVKANEGVIYNYPFSLQFIK